MFKKFCIFLFITIFCNGVAYSSTKANPSDLISKERTAATETVSHINHKIEPDNTTSDAGLHHFENPSVKTSDNHLITENKTITNSTGVENITKQASNTKNNVENTTEATAGNSPMPTAVTHNATSVPVTHVSNVTDLPPRNFSDMSRPIVAGQNTTTVTTPAVGTNTKAPVTTSTFVTPTPAPAVSTSMGNVIVVHNSSTKSEENRFDGASFVGGIVLTIGLTAIGFIAFKYYKSGYY